MLLSAFNWYGGLIGGGMVLCIVLAYFMAKRRGYDTDNVFNVAIICIPLAIIGARTYFVVNDIIHNGTEWTIGRYFGFRVDGSFEGFAGLAIYGGLIGGIIGALIIRIFNRKKPLPKQMTFIQMADLYFCLIILGQAIGRWGNFANGEAYGQLISDPAWQWFPFAVFIENGKFGRGWYNACFFYESMWNLIGFGLLQWLYNGKRKSFDGFCFAFYCIWYGIIRFFVEGLRSDSMYFGSIKANQLLSALIFLLGAGIIIYHIVMAKRSHKKIMIFVDEKDLSLDYYGYEKTFMYLKTTFAQGEGKESEAEENGSAQGEGKENKQAEEGKSDLEQETEKRADESKESERDEEENDLIEQETEMRADESKENAQGEDKENEQSEDKDNEQVEGEENVDEKH